MGCDLTLTRHSIINYGNVFPLLRLVLGREIQGLSFDVWCSVELCELKVVNLCFWWWSKNTGISIGQDEQLKNKA